MKRTHIFTNWVAQRRVSYSCGTANKKVITPINDRFRKLNIKVSAWRKGNWSMWSELEGWILLVIPLFWLVMGDLLSFSFRCVSTRIQYITKATASGGGSRACSCPPVVSSLPAALVETPRGWELNSTGLTLGGPTLSSWGPHDILGSMGEGGVPKIAGNLEKGRGQSAGGRDIKRYKHTACN